MMVLQLIFLEPFYTMSANPSVSSSAGWTTVRGPPQRIPIAEFPMHAVAAFSKTKSMKPDQTHFSETASRAFSRPTTSVVSHHNIGFPESASTAFGGTKQTHASMPSAFASGNGSDNRRDDTFDTNAASAFGKKRPNKSNMSDVPHARIVETRSNSFSNMIAAALPSSTPGITPVDYNKSALRKAEAAPSSEDMFPALGSTTTSMVTPKKSFADVIRQRAAADEAEAAKAAEMAARARMEAQRIASERSNIRIGSFQMKKSVVNSTHEEYDEFETPPDIHDLDYVPPYQRKSKSNIPSNIDEDFIAEEDEEQTQDYED
jgi:hypothetical protein